MMARRDIRWILVALVLASSLGTWADGPDSPGAGKGVPLSRYLNPDGSLNLPPEGILAASIQRVPADQRLERIAALRVGAS